MSLKIDDKTTFYFSKICGRPSQRVENSSFRQPNHPIQERKKVNLTSQLSERAIVYTRNILCWCGYFVGVGGERKRKCLCCKYPMIRKRILFIHCGSCQWQKDCIHEEGKGLAVVVKTGTFWYTFIQDSNAKSKLWLRSYDGLCLKWYSNLMRTMIWSFMMMIRSPYINCLRKI